METCLCTLTWIYSKWLLCCLVVSMKHGPWIPQHKYYHGAGSCSSQNTPRYLLLRNLCFVYMFTVSLLPPWLQCPIQPACKGGINQLFTGFDYWNYKPCSSSLWLSLWTTLCVDCDFQLIQDSTLHIKTIRGLTDAAVQLEVHLTMGWRNSKRLEKSQHQ